MSSPNPQRWQPGNEHNQCVGADLASAATIAPTHRIHWVTGTAEITTITLPWVTFSGDLILVPSGASTTNVGGNIAVAIAHVANRPMQYVYLPAKGLWYPAAVV